MNRKELIEAIKAIKYGVVRDNVVELAEFISFNDNEIVSYNNEISISYPYDTGLVGAVKGDELLNILQKMPDDISIEIKKEKLVITKKGKNKITASLNLLPVQTDIWPEIPEDFGPLPENIVEGIKFCLFSVANDPSMGALNCILMDNNVLSCDNFRATQFKLDDFVSLESPLLIPLSLAKVLVNYDIINFTQDDSWLFFEDEQGVIICCKKVEYDYPIEQVYGLFKSKGEMVNLPDGFQETLDRSEILSQVDIENQKIVKLELLKNKLIISSEGDIGAYKEEVKLDYKGEGITILVNPVHLKQILNNCSEFMLTESNINFKTDTFNHVIALIAN
jgi:DNA polymerase-3 subunit beta